MFWFWSVRPRQVLDPQYGMYVWPCAVVLAQYLWTRRDELRDKTVLEVRTLGLMDKPVLSRVHGRSVCVLSSVQV